MVMYHQGHLDFSETWKRESEENIWKIFFPSSLLWLFYNPLRCVSLISSFLYIFFLSAANVYVCFVLQVSATQLLEHATNHIKQLQERVEERRRQRALLLKESIADENKKPSGSRLPSLNIKCSDLSLEIDLICGLEKNFMLHDIISILQEEGAEVVSSTQYNAGDRIIYIIKSQVYIYLFLNYFF